MSELCEYVVSRRDGLYRCKNKAITEIVITDTTVYLCGSHASIVKRLQERKLYYEKLLGEIEQEEQEMIRTTEILRRKEG